MQEVTDLPFWKLMAVYGGADVYVTEYFRVHATSTLRKHILKSITENPTGQPVIAQMIGNDIPSLVRTARELQQYPIAAVDLNLGCPAPVVYRKCAGGGLLREPRRVDAILGALRDAVKIKFTVKPALDLIHPKFSMNCCRFSRSTRWTCWSSTAARFVSCIAEPCITNASRVPLRECPVRCWPMAMCIPPGTRLKF